MVEGEQPGFEAAKDKGQAIQQQIDLPTDRAMSLSRARVC